MKFFAPLSLAALVSGHALPKAESQLHERDFQSVTLVFEAAAASYNMTFPADGQEHFTSIVSPLFSLPGALSHLTNPFFVNHARASNITMPHSICRPLVLEHDLTEHFSSQTAT